MNTIYRLVWSVAKAQWTPVSELSRARGKRGRCVLLAAALCAGATATQATEATERTEPTEVLEPDSAAETDGESGADIHSVAPGASDGRTSSASDRKPRYSAGESSDSGNLKNNVAIGWSASAVDLGATAVGGHSTALKGGTAFGSGAKSDESAVSVGHNSQAFIAGVAAGEYATASGSNSVAVGWSAASTEIWSIAIGSKSEAKAYSSLALGSHARALAQDAHALGDSSVANATAATAIGAYAQANQGSSVALGSYSQTDAANTVSVGTRSYKRRITNVGNGVADSDAMTLGQWKAADQRTALFAANGTNAKAPSAAGIGSIAIGSGAKTPFENSVAIGAGASSEAMSQVVLGHDARANQGQAIAIGDRAQVFTNLGGMAIGANAFTKGEYAIAFGKSAQALGQGTLALGLEAATSGDAWSMAIGARSQATARASMAFGGSAVAGAENAIALGMNSNAAGARSMALGDQAQTGTDAYAIALGNGTKAIGKTAIAVGSSAEATVADALSVGANSQATATRATALGKLSVASHEGAVALGAGSATSAANTVSVGSASTKRRVMNVGNGIDASDAATVGQLNAATAVTKLVSVNGTGISYAMSTNSIAVGTSAEGMGRESIAIGSSTKALNESIAIGKNAKASWSSQVVVGEAAEGKSAYAVAIGSGAVAGTKAGTGEGSIAIGRLAAAAESGTVIGMGAHGAVRSLALGNNAQAQGASSIALGDGSVTGTGSFSTAVGSNARASHDNSVALGADSATVAYNTVSVGNATNKRRITNVGVGVDDADAVAMSQLKQTNATVNGHTTSLAAHDASIRRNATDVGTLRSGLDLAGTRIDTISTTVSSHTDRIEALEQDSGASPYLAVSATDPKAASAAGEDSLALGNEAVSTGDGSVALGSHSHADQAGVVSIGDTAKGLKRRLINVADGTAASDAATVGQVNRVHARVDAVDTDMAGIVKPTLQVHTDAIAALSLESEGLRRVFAHQVDANNSPVAVAEGAGDLAIGSGASARSGGADPASAVAIGQGSGAMNGAVAVGAGSMAGDRGTAVGFQSAAGKYGIAFGDMATAGTTSLGIGKEAEASGSSSVALGFEARGTALQAFALGSQSQATAEAALAVGSATMASAIRSMALGFNAKVTAENSVALGANSVADAFNTVSLGGATTKRRVTNMADGIELTDGVNVRQMNSIRYLFDEQFNLRSLRGQDSIALGNDAIAMGDGSVALGSHSRANDAHVVSVGDDATGLRRKLVNVANGSAKSDAATFGQLEAVRDTLSDLRNDVAAGSREWHRTIAHSPDESSQAPVATAGGSLAIGIGAKALGGVENNRAIAIGVRSVAGLGGMAVGGGATAGAESVALGFAEAGVKSVAAGLHASATSEALALGTYAGALGISSVSLGTSARSLSDYGIAAGYQATASGEDAIAIGHGSEARYSDSIAIGKKSVSDASGTLSIGDVGLNRRITHVADGIDRTDAATVGQLKASSLIDSQGRSSKAVVYDADGVGVTFKGFNGSRLTNVADGLVASGSRDAVNGGQLASMSDQLTKKIDGIDQRVETLEAHDLPDSADSGSSDAGSRSGAKIAASRSIQTPQASGDVENEAAQNDDGASDALALVHNVAAGEAPTDAVNVTQLNAQRDQAIKAAQVYTDQRFDAVKQDMDDLRKDVGSRFQQVDRRIDRMAAMSGAYAGMAMNTAGLDGANRVGAGVGSQRGQKAIAVGYQHVIGGRASFSIGGAAGGSDRSVNAGAGFSW